MADDESFWDDVEGFGRLPRDEPLRIAGHTVVPSDVVREAPASVRAVVEAEMAQAIHESLRAMRTASYEPVGLILHPRDEEIVYVHYAVATVSEDDPDLRRAAQAAIADAFGVPHWIAGVDGAKAPLRLRVRSWLRRAPRRALLAMPGVRYEYRGTGGWTDPVLYPRAGRWFLFVGNYVIGRLPNEEEW